MNHEFLCFKTLFYKLLGMLLVSLAFLSPSISAQGTEALVNLKNLHVLSADGKSFSYSQISRKYQVVIFTRLDDCRGCVSEEPPWMKKIVNAHISACWVFVSRSPRIAEYYYHEGRFVQYDFFCDSSETIAKMLSKKTTPVLLMFGKDGNVVFFDNPMYEEHRFMNAVGLIDSSETKR